MFSSFGRPSNEHDRYIVLRDCSLAAIRTTVSHFLQTNLRTKYNIIFHAVYNDFYIIFNAHNIKYECTQYTGIACIAYGTVTT